MKKRLKEVIPSIHDFRQWSRIESVFKFKRGDVLRVVYMCVLGLRIRRRFTFVGLCLYTTSKGFCLSNIHNGAPVCYTFMWPAATILSVDRLPGYKFSSRTNRMHDRNLHIVFKAQPSDSPIMTPYKEVEPGNWKVLSRYAPGVFRRFYIFRNKYRGKW